MEEFRQQVLDLLSAKTGRPVSASDSFVELQVDSVAMAELAYEVEQLLGIRADEGVLDCETVDQLIVYAWQLKTRPDRPPADS
jgi:acyl carrier protein